MSDKKTYRRQKREVSSNIEEYLETIYRIEQREGSVRVKDISRELDVTYASTSEILKKMADLGLVEHERYGYARLTEKGREIAKTIEEREDALLYLFHEVLGIDREEALKDACRIEHDISDLAIQKLMEWIEFIKSNPGIRQELDSFKSSSSSE